MLSLTPSPEQRRGAKGKGRRRKRAEPNHLAEWLTTLRDSQRLSLSLALYICHFPEPALADRLLLAGALWDMSRTCHGRGACKPSLLLAGALGGRTAGRGGDGDLCWRAVGEPAPRTEWCEEVMV